jgi:DNA-binding transcriptional ArsR family regulator
MYIMDNRTLKDLLYEQVARVGKALASPKRLEMLEMLAQGEKAVESVAAEVGIDVKLASAHLKALKEARLVQSRREGKRMVYRLSGKDVANLGVTLRQVAEEHLLELRLALQQVMAEPDRLASVGRKELLAQAKRGEVLVLDVRPRRSTTPPTCRSPDRCRCLSWPSVWPNCRGTWRSSPTAAARFA